MNFLPRNKNLFTRFSARAAHYAGHPMAFLGAFAVIIIWGLSGPVFGFSDTWQLIINTGTTIVTFLIVFLIQNTQNRGTTALQLKLDELIRATEGAHTVLLDLEELSENELETIRDQYEEIAAKARKRLRSGKSDTNIPEVILDDGFQLKKAGRKE